MALILLEWPVDGCTNAKKVRQLTIAGPFNFKIP